MSEQQQIEQRGEQQTEAIFRPLYLRRVPETVWNRVHENAIRSRLRLQAYLIKLMEQCHPFPPQPLPTASRPPKAAASKPNSGSMMLPQRDS